MNKQDRKNLQETASLKRPVLIVVTAFILLLRSLIKIMGKYAFPDVVTVTGKTTRGGHPEVPTGMDSFKLTLTSV